MGATDIIGLSPVFDGHDGGFARGSSNRNNVFTGHDGEIKALILFYYILLSPRTYNIKVRVAHMYRDAAFSNSLSDAQYHICEILGCTIRIRLLFLKHTKYNMQENVQNVRPLMKVITYTVAR